MYKYFVETYTMKCNILGYTKIAKEDNDLAMHLNEMSSKGWELVSISTFDTADKEFKYKIVYRK